MDHPKNSSAGNAAAAHVSPTMKKVKEFFANNDPDEKPDFGPLIAILEKDQERLIEYTRLTIMKFNQLLELRASMGLDAAKAKL